MPLAGRQGYSLIDYDSEVGGLSFKVAARSAANWAAQETLAGNFKIALAAIVRDNTIIKEEITNVTTSTPTPPDDVFAQRENKWRVDYHDGTTGKFYQVEIPCADLEVLDPNDRAHAHIGDEDVVDAFIAAFVAYALTPDGNAPIVDEITFVGRNV